MKTLDELWYGNISPFEQCTRGDKRLKELLDNLPEEVNVIVAVLKENRNNN